MIKSLGMLARSAIPESSKRSTAINEITRRLKNHSLKVNKTVVESSLVKYMDNLRGMGFSQS